MHNTLPFVLAMVVAIVLLEMLATRLKIAYPILLVVAGLLLSLVPSLPAVTIDPDLIFFIFLPPLLFEASWSISFKEMKKWWRMIGSFAFPVVFFTALSVALLTTSFIPGFTLALGFLLGGIVSPPDAVSTGAITKFVRIPRVSKALLEGESLLNDASSLIIFRFALIAVGTGQFIWQQAALSFLWMVVGGAGIGLLLGWLFVKGHRLLNADAPSTIVLTLIEPYVMYWLAEQFHSSGVLAVVGGGLFMSTHRMLFMNSTSRVRGYSVWESFVFILNGIVFFLIGLALPQIVRGLRADGIPLHTAIWYGVLVTVILIVVRIISIYTAGVFTFLFRRNVIPQGAVLRRPWLLVLVMGWTGMRGVVSLAAALSIPVALSNGSAFPYRNLILFITFIVILLTLTIQGLTLPLMIQRWRVFDGVVEEPEEEVKQRLQLRLREYTYQFLKQKHVTDWKDYADLEKILRHWEEKAAESKESHMTEETKNMYLELLENQRKFLGEISVEPTMLDEVMRWQVFQLDLEEERIRLL